MKIFNILTNKFITLIITVSLLIYVAFTLVSQSHTINANRKLLGAYKENIEKQKMISHELDFEKEQIGSDAFVEKIARQRLGLCKSTEKLFVDGRSD